MVQPNWKFLDNDGTFVLENPGKISRLYFPLCNEAGLLANITPKLKGSVKIDQNSFLTLPVSIEDLHMTKSNRNFWIKKGEEIWSTTGVAKNKSQYDENVKVTCGLLWHELTRENKTLGLTSIITNFVPASSDRVEIMMVTIRNQSSETIQIDPVAAIPIYGRSADNLRDHRHVTSLLNRTELHRHGVLVTPTMTFDERGHHINHKIYAVLGCDENGKAPAQFYPTVESFIGEGGSFEYPKSLFEDEEGQTDLQFAQGKEAMGAFRFATTELKPNAQKTYILLLGISETQDEIQKWIENFGTLTKANAALQKNKAFWVNKVNQVSFDFKDPILNNWLKWLSLQPTFRKIFGNSFLPDFDYGRGGRGWRDLWQDCLALLLTHPDETQKLLLHNFGGVRVDGSNATIISNRNYAFIADRNNITRVWMDHGVWPLVTTELYIHESGNIQFLFEKAPYFRDPQQSRAQSKDTAWTEAYGTRLKTKQGRVYLGTLIEHILVQHLVQFFNVGPHNHIRLENADWNDGLDMASKKGESVTFTAFYAGNLRRIVTLLEYLMFVKKKKDLKLFKELLPLLDARKTKPKYSTTYKKKLLDKYFKTVQPELSGKMVSVPLQEIIDDLDYKSSHLMKNIRSKEWITTSSGDSYFNGYYDNSGARVEGDHRLGTRMTLTGQVFPIFSGTAEKHHIEKIIQSVNKYLKDKRFGGYHLNTDFKEIQPNLGRAFSFAYGEKENGAFFNHMCVMYANSLYRREFVQEGYEVLKSIYQMCVNTEVSKIYPGLPEYFNNEGRGLYHYLTGSASWYFMTLLTECFGVKGHFGDLLLEPKLVSEQFATDPTIALQTFFAERKIHISYHNPERLTYGKYQFGEVRINQKPIVSVLSAPDAFLIPRNIIASLPADKVNRIEVNLVHKTAGDKQISYTNPLINEVRKKNLDHKDKKFKEKKLQGFPNLMQLSFKNI